METALNIGKSLTLENNMWIFFVCNERKIVHELKEKLKMPESESES